MFCVLAFYLAASSLNPAEAFLILQIIVSSAIGFCTQNTFFCLFPNIFPPFSCAQKKIISEVPHSSVLLENNWRRLLVTKTSTYCNMIHWTYIYKCWNFLQLNFCISLVLIQCTLVFNFPGATFVWIWRFYYVTVRVIRLNI